METKKTTIEQMHAFLRGNGAKFSNDTARDVIPQIRNYNRRERDQVMRDLGLKKVRGMLGGTYWE
jgi:hypothetical protein